MHQGNLDLIGFCDSDYAADETTRRSTTGFVVSIGNSPVSWVSRLQKSVALSTCESEYMAMTDCLKDIIWFQKLLKDLDIPVQLPTKIKSDNQGAIQLTKDPRNHKRTKHIDVRYHFIRDSQDQGDVKLEYIPTQDNPSDMLTKPLCSPSLNRCMKTLQLA